MFPYTLDEQGHPTGPSQVLAPPAPDTSGFGRSLALWNNTLVVGAPSFDRGDNRDEGAAMLYTRDPTTGTWSPEPVALPPQAGTRYDFAGTSVAVNDEFVAVGTPGAQRDAATRDDEGAVHLFRVTDGQHLAVLWPDGDETAFGQMGHSVALSGRLLAAGAPGPFTLDERHDDYQGSGSTFIFDLTAPSAPSVIKHELPLDPLDHFGSAVSIDDEQIAVGAAFEDSCATSGAGDDANNDCQDNGAVYIVPLTPKDERE